MPAKEDAKKGLDLIRGSILTELRTADEGMGNSELAIRLGLRSDVGGKQKDYLTYSVLGLLLRDGKVEQRNDRKWQIKRVA